jgi:hypothetical protein
MFLSFSQLFKKFISTFLKQLLFSLSSYFFDILNSLLKFLYLMSGCSRRALTTSTCPLQEAITRGVEVDISPVRTLTVIK